jgi:type I restriction enzyme R subunit
LLKNGKEEHHPRFHPQKADEIHPSQKARFRVCFRLPFGRPPRRLRRHPSKEGNFLKFHPLKANEIHPSQKARFCVCFRLAFAKPHRQSNQTGENMTKYNVVAEMPVETVVSEWTPAKKRSNSYQSEADLEAEFIRLLQMQGYEYLNIESEQALIQNLRKSLERLNNMTFTDREWERFFSDCIANKNDHIAQKTRKIQEDHVQTFRRDDNSSKNVSLMDKKNIHNNRLQIINQYEANEGAYKNRYDATILVNGLPLVHIELKRRGAMIREAFNQINRYQRDSFWSGCGLFEYVQIFIISNGSNTKYYSNTTRRQSVKEKEGFRKGKKTSHSFEFTSFWADGNNKPIHDLVDFTKTFLSKHSILNVLSRYCVFTSEEMLLVMRPYQIAATERILSRIETASNYKKYGSIDGGGYIWHTTGSGKTLTSFKTAQLAAKLNYIDKVLFIVDRRDLDYQTMKEYDRFEKGAANGNTSTKALQKQLEDSTSRIIITTIQKIGLFIERNKTHDIYKKRIVLIFDECHRSHFGDLHIAITKRFSAYHMFGFTGTPIFAENSALSGNPILKTTEQAFGDKLHSYTIVDAINDGNVLPFRVDFIDTIKKKEGIKDKQVTAINTDKAMLDSRRIGGVVDYILEHFDQKTKRNEYYDVKDKKINGFNSIFAVSKIAAAKLYYDEFRKRKHNLKIAVIFSYSANEDDADEDFNNDKLDKNSRDFLEGALSDYNAMFKTAFDTSSDKFQNYYKDLSMRVKNREVDMLIVVNMFLTGFDATMLNTLWVDKEFRQHTLLQAFSRTNRILNSVKTFGNIICFRDIEKETNDAIALFGNRDAGGIVLIKTFSEYMKGYEKDGKRQPGYEELIKKLTKDFPLGKPIVGEENNRQFIKLFGAVLKLQNILSAFDDFKGAEILPQRDIQDYQGIYLDIRDQMIRSKSAQSESINEDLVFEMELIRQIEINIDYILMLVEKYKDGACKDKSILDNVFKAAHSSVQLRSKKELIDMFIKRVNAQSNIKDDWSFFVLEEFENDLKAIVKDENLKEDETRKLIGDALSDGALKTGGMGIDKILPPMSRFGGAAQEREKKKQDIIVKLNIFFDKYFGIMDIQQ